MTLTNRDIAIYLNKNYEPVRKWPLDMVQRWFEWFEHFNLHEIIVNESNDIKAIAFARPVEKSEDGLEEYHYDPTGTCLFVDMVICEEGTKKQLLEAIYRKMGSMKKIAFKRVKNLHSIREYDFNKFMKFFVKGDK